MLERSSAATRAGEVPDGRWRGEERRLGSDKDGERRWLIRNGDFKKISLFSHGLTHAQHQLITFLINNTFMRDQRCGFLILDMF